MERTQNGTTMQVIKTGEGFDIIVTKWNGDKVFDFAYSQARAWEIARQHAGI